MTENTTETTMPKIIYGLYLASFILPFSGLIGLIMALVNHSDAPEWLQTHYRFQIRTFWIAILYSIIDFLLINLGGIGIILLFLTALWFIVRCVKGLKWLIARQAVPNPFSWMWS